MPDFGDWVYGDIEMESDPVILAHPTMSSACLLPEEKN